MRPQTLLWLTEKNWYFDRLYPKGKVMKMKNFEGIHSIPAGEKSWNYCSSQMKRKQPQSGRTSREPSDRTPWKPHLAGSLQRLLSSQGPIHQELLPTQQASAGTSGSPGVSCLHHIFPHQVCALAPGSTAQAPVPTVRRPRRPCSGQVPGNCGLLTACGECPLQIT